MTDGRQGRWVVGCGRLDERRRRVRELAVSVVAVAAALGFAACNGSSSDDAGVAFEAPNGALDAAGVADDGDTASAAARSDEPVVDLASAQRPGDRDVIYTAYMEIGAKDVERAAREARDVVADAGGFLFTASEQGLDGELPSVTLTFKVPPDEYEAVLDAFGDLGRVAERSVESEDVTGQVVDLDARLAAATTSADRLRVLLAEAGNVGDLLNVERELAAREAQVESLTGQLAAAARAGRPRDDNAARGQALRGDARGERRHPGVRRGVEDGRSGLRQRAARRSDRHRVLSPVPRARSGRRRPRPPGRPSPSGAETSRVGHAPRPTVGQSE